MVITHKPNPWVISLTCLTAYQSLQMVPDRLNMTAAGVGPTYEQRLSEETEHIQNNKPKSP